MGLLDDAIREHLELRLRNGADPDEIVQAEHEALDPVSIEPPAAPHDAPAAGVDDDVAVYEDTAMAAPSGEDTAEFDMGEVLHAEHGGAPDDEPLEWETPAEHEEADIPGQERLNLD